MNVVANLEIAALAAAIEAAIGYPPALFAAIGHPVSWLGALIAWLDRRLNREDDSFARRRLSGVLALGLVLIAAGGASMALGRLAAETAGFAALLFVALIASSLIAQRSLHQHVEAVARALDDGGLEAGRKAVAAIVGRDVSVLDEAGVARAAIESLAENFSDGIVAPLFWLALGGLPGGVCYKAINTADSMIGHRTERYEAFGWAAARLDDLVNLGPARLSALWIVIAAVFLQADPAGAWRVMRRDARGHPSPNAGWPEAAVAGALGLKLGGPRSYAGKEIADRWIGFGESSAAGPSDIFRALALYRRACLVNGGVLAGLALLLIARG